MSTDILRIATPAGPIHCRLDGPRGAPCIVFSNSHATDLTLWDEQALPLARDYRVLRYDQRGHGRTPPAATPCSFDSLAADVILLMDALDIAQAALVGVSMGAVTMLRVAARFPSRASCVLASDGQWCAPQGARALWQARIDQAEQEGMANLARLTARRWISEATSRRSPALLARLEGMIRATPIAGYAACARAMQSYDFRDDFPALSMPVTYVAGACDGRLPGVMQEMAAATPGGHYVEIPDTGHLPCVEQPRRFLECIETALSETRASTPRSRHA